MGSIGLLLCGLALADRSRGAYERHEHQIGAERTTDALAQRVRSPVMAIWSSYLALTALATLAFLASAPVGAPFEHALIDATAALSTAGLTTGFVGPYLPAGTLLAFCALMLLGRLEVNALLVLAMIGLRRLRALRSSRRSPPRSPRHLGRRRRGAGGMRIRACRCPQPQIEDLQRRRNHHDARDAGGEPVARRDLLGGDEEVDETGGEARDGEGEDVPDHVVLPMLVDEEVLVIGHGASFRCPSLATPATRVLGVEFGAQRANADEVSVRCRRGRLSVRFDTLAEGASPGGVARHGRPVLRLYAVARRVGL